MSIPDILAALDQSAALAYHERRFRDLRSGLVISAAFARLSANAPVAESEQALVAWVADGTVPAYLRQQRTVSLSALRGLTPEQATVMYAASDETRLRMLDRLPGFGPTKAAFGLSLAGFARLPCLDRHICRLHGLAESKVARLCCIPPERAAPAYLRYCRQVYPTGDMRLQQWTDYARIVPAFARSLHGPVIELVLAAYADRLEVA